MIGWLIDLLVKLKSMWVNGLGVIWDAIPAFSCRYWGENHEIPNQNSWCRDWEVSSIFPEGKFRTLSGHCDSTAVLCFHTSAGVEDNEHFVAFSEWHVVYTEFHRNHSIGVGRIYTSYLIQSEGWSTTVSSWRIWWLFKLRIGFRMTFDVRRRAPCHTIQSKDCVTSLPFNMFPNELTSENKHTIVSLINRVADPRGRAVLRSGSAAACLLGLRVRVSPEGMDFCLLWMLRVVQAHVSASGRSLVQRSPTKHVQAQ